MLGSSGGRWYREVRTRRANMNGRIRLKVDGIEKVHVAVSRGMIDLSGLTYFTGVRATFDTTRSFNLPGLLGWRRNLKHTTS